MQQTSLLLKEAFSFPFSLQMGLVFWVIAQREAQKMEKALCLIQPRPHCSSVGGPAAAARASVYQQGPVIRLGYGDYGWGVGCCFFCLEDI